jgi:hypothetical protein
VNTLLAVSNVVGMKRRASSIDESHGDGDKQKKTLQQFQQKYLTGDLGEGMSADLNYTLKRLIRGLTSDDHSVKRGFFLGTCDVVARFKKQIDILKFIKFINEETKTSTVMKNPEIHAMMLGRLMSLTALVECRVYEQSKTQIN